MFIPNGSTFEQELAYRKQVEKTNIINTFLLLGAMAVLFTIALHIGYGLTIPF